MFNFGEEQGQLCWRNGCQGFIDLIPSDDGCTCFLGHPPCRHCTTPKEYCPECGWRADEEDCREYFNGYVKIGKNWQLAPIHPQNVNWHYGRNNWRFGVYPVGMIEADVAREMGVSGGKFALFKNGKFAYEPDTE
jgi:hypothetical protein